MDLVDLSRNLVAGGLVARVFLAGAAALVVAAILMAAARWRFAGRVMGRALAIVGLALLTPTALVGTVARLAEPTPAAVYTPCTTSGELPVPPEAPPRGCLLAVEWQQPGSVACGLIVTAAPVQLPEGTVGRWWIQSPFAAQQHIVEFQAAHPDCTIVDQR